MGEYLRFEGEFDRAWAVYAEALEIGRELGLQRTINTVLLNQTRVLIPKGKLEPVPGMILECVEIIHANDMLPWATGLFDIMAGLLAGREDWETAARFLGAAQAAYEKFDYHREPPDAKFAEEVFAKTRAALDPAAYQTAYDAGHLLSIDEGLESIQTLLA